MLTYTDSSPVSLLSLRRRARKHALKDQPSREKTRETTRDKSVTFNRSWSVVLKQFKSQLKQKVRKQLKYTPNDFLLCILINRRRLALSNRNVNKHINILCLLLSRNTVTVVSKTLVSRIERSSKFYKFNHFMEDICDIHKFCISYDFSQRLCENCTI